MSAPTTAPASCGVQPSRCLAESGGVHTATCKARAGRGLPSIHPSPTDRPTPRRHSRRGPEHAVASQPATCARRRRRRRRRAARPGMRLGWGAEAARARDGREWRGRARALACSRDGADVSSSVASSIATGPERPATPRDTSWTRSAGPARARQASKMWTGPRLARAPRPAAARPSGRRVDGAGSARRGTWATTLGSQWAQRMMRALTASHPPWPTFRWRHCCGGAAYVTRCNSP
eukprot:scaffold360_cov334-Prasinococcus_capsulatus_cf.AAC.2